jgi:monofunctional biosynthetic peptidoglycan transglycosylase
MSWRRKLLRSRPARLLARLGKAARWTLRLLLLFLVLDLFYLATTWPNWHQLATGPIPKSAFMQEYEREQMRPRWQPVALSTMPKHMLRAVVLAEDSRFYEHSGFDLIAFKEAMDYNLSEGRLAVGASTISQQTVKNLFLSSSKSPLRKWHELILTWGMERHLKKPRIMELYLNIAEFGPGIYGVQAAAQAYWGIGIAQIDARQAAELAATLPSPTKNNPATRTAQFGKRAARILRLLVRHPGDAADSVGGFANVLEGSDEASDAAANRETDSCEGDDCPAETAGPTQPTAPPADTAPGSQLDPSSRPG